MVPVLLHISHIHILDRNNQGGTPREEGDDKIWHMTSCLSFLIFSQIFLGGLRGDYKKISIPWGIFFDNEWESLNYPTLLWEFRDFYLFLNPNEKLKNAKLDIYRQLFLFFFILLTHKVIYFYQRIFEPYVIHLREMGKFPPFFMIALPKLPFNSPKIICFSTLREKLAKAFQSAFLVPSIPSKKKIFSEGWNFK